MTMLCEKHPPLRNKVDLADARQVRVIKKRLGVSRDDLRRIVEKVGNSIAAVTKEAEIEKAASCSKPISPITTSEVSLLDKSPSTS
jgi:hypothetical protein